MAPSRGKGKARAVEPSAGAPTSRRRTTRSSRKTKGGSVDVYSDMLAEATITDPSDDASDRPLKRRRVARKAEVVAVPAPANEEHGHPTSPDQQEHNLQTIEDSSASDDEEESDFGFEDVDLEQPSASSPAGHEDDGIADVSVSVNSAPKHQVRLKRKPASVAEKAHRLQVHQTHVLCLLGHCIYVNSWCNNTAVQRHLRSLLPKHVVSFLNPKAKDSQFRQNEAFMDGLRQAADAFRGAFKVTASGMRSAQWETGANDVETIPMDRSDFVTAAEKLEGSQDTGNQLFCALLRAVGVEARLVCSLQPLPFHSPSTKPTTPQKTPKPVVYAMASSMRSSAPNSDTDDSTIKTSATVGKVPSARRRLGQPSFAPEPGPVAAPSKSKKSIRKLTYPVFWVEAFNSSHQKWIPVDPLVTATVAKPSKLEPPSSYVLNQLSYAIAFEDDCVARDVTRRYARAFNAKTRRTRVESTPNGGAWFNKVMRFFRRRGGAFDRDQVEDAELSQREAREGLPANVLDFKDHPYYALERHMKRHEVIHPRREVGKVNAGTAAKPRMEAVFRRNDVCVCRSADKWFRLGREVKEGEQALKRIPAPRSKRLQRSPSAGLDGDGGGSEEREMTPLYAHFQTMLYIPAPVRNGKVPRNAFGNLDVYVSSMVPAGGVHVRHTLGRDAARALGVDWVDAVVGFKFEGRRGTPVVDGVVIPEESADAVKIIIEGLLDERVQEEAMARSRIALAMWRKFLIGLRIKERVATYGDAAGDVAMEDDGSNEAAGFEAGGFVQSDAADTETLPTAGKFSLVELAAGIASKSKSSTFAKPKARKKAEDESEEEAEIIGYESEDGDEETAYHPSSRVTRSRRKIVDEDDDANDSAAENGDGSTFVDKHSPEEGGGFLVESNDDEGGGFLQDDNEDDSGGGGLVPDNAGGFESDHDDLGKGFMVDDTEIDNHNKDASQPTTLHTEGAHDLQGGKASTPQADEQHDLYGNTTVSAEVPIEKRAMAAIDDHSTTEAPTQAPEDPLIANENLTARVNDHQVGHPGRMEIDQPDESEVTAKAATGLDTTLDVIESDAEQTDESDRGSMLSHDPEDSDAEPEWMESD